MEETGYRLCNHPSHPGPSLTGLNKELSPSETAFIVQDESLNQLNIF